MGRASHHAYRVDVFQRAWHASKEHFLWGAPVATTVVAFSISWYRQGWEIAVTQDLLPALYWGAAAAVVAVIVFCINMVRSAGRIHDEQLRTIRQFENRLLELSKVEERRAKAERALEAVQARVDELERNQEFRVGLSTVLGVRCLVVLSPEWRSTDDYEMWAVITNLVLTNQTDRQLPIAISVVFGTKGDVLRKVAVVSPAPPPEWVLNQASEHINGQAFLASPKNLPGRESTPVVYCTVKMSARWLGLLNVDEPGQIAEELPLWLEVRNNLHRHGQLVQFELNKHALQAKLASYGIALRVEP